MADDPLFAEARKAFDEAALGLPDTELALWMLDTVAHAVIHRALIDRPGDFSRELLAEELITLLVGYLKRR